MNKKHDYWKPSKNSIIIALLIIIAFLIVGLIEANSADATASQIELRRIQ